MKKVITLILVISICLTSIITTYATTPNSIAYNENELYEISRLLYDTYNSSIFDLSNFNLSDLRLGSPINSYTYLDGELVVSSNQYIPVYCGNNICGTVISFSTPDNGTNYTYSESYSSELNSFINENNSIAIVGVEDGTIAISADNYTVLSGTATDNEISVLTQNSENITYSEVLKYSELELSMVFPRSGNHNTLNVPIWNQPSAHTCWLASIGSVGEYKTSSNIDYYHIALIAAQVQSENGTMDNGSGSISETKTVLKRAYNLNSTIYTSSPSTTVVMNQINSDKPILAGCFPSNSSNSEGHMVVFNGYASSSNHFTLVYMDPTKTSYQSVNITSSIYIVSNNITYTCNSHLRLT